jgi:hypothetical protein
LTRREFFTVCTKENLKQALKTFQNMKEGEKETLRRSCDEVGRMFFKNRLHKMK